MSRFLVILCLCLFSSVSSRADFTVARPDYRYQFPRDHGAHPDFKIEWWYYTGNLKTADGKRFGIQWTMFRNSLSEKPATSMWMFASNQVYFAHAAVSDVNSDLFYYDERRSRGFGAEAFASVENLNLKILDWSCVDNGSVHHLRAHGKNFSYDLKLMPTKPLAYHGVNGVTHKGGDESNASHYLSFTRMSAEGEIIFDGVSHAVTGVMWMDHEFSSSQLSDQAIGWDWFSIQLDDGTELMLYFLRLKNGQYDLASSGSYVNAEGAVQEIKFSDLRIEHGSKDFSLGVYPRVWTIDVKSLGLKFQVHIPVSHSELDTKNSTGVAYWESPIDVVAETKDGTKVTGVGFVEMTGYRGQDLEGKLND